MDIQEPNIKWNGSLIKLDLKKVDSIALHHMAHPTWTFEKVHDYHKRVNGWIGIGYNYWIDFDGIIYKGRGLNKGAGVGNHNSHIISIGFQGDYENTNTVMPQLQYNAGVKLIKYLLKEIPSIKIIDGHKKWNSTACPRKIFSINRND